MAHEDLDFSDAKMLRIKAEEMLIAKQKKEIATAMETDVLKLVHELQVHQIELEMQNEELKQAHETAEMALKKYTMLYDLAPMGYFSLDQEGGICDLNFTGADMLHERRFSLLGSNFKLFISKEYLPVFNEFFRKVYMGISKESCQVLLGYDKHTLGYVYMEGVVTGEERRCLLSVVDISEFSKQGMPKT
jgi:PAS domain-containing protein